MLACLPDNLMTLLQCTSPCIQACADADMRSHEHSHSTQVNNSSNAADCLLEQPRNPDQKYA